MIHDIVLAVMVTLIVNEVTGVSPWLAVRLIRWAAEHIYATNADRAAQRKEEWEALLDSIPTDIAKLFFGLGFACAGLYWIVIRCMPPVLETIPKMIEGVLELIDDEEIGGGIMVAWIVFGSTFMPFLDWLMATGALFVLLLLVIGLGALCEAAATSIRRHI